MGAQMTDRAGKTDTINASIEAVAAHYAGAGERRGARVHFDCPRCGRAGALAVHTTEHRGGCFKKGCELGGYMDAIALIAAMEGYALEGRDFRAAIRRGVEILEGRAPEGCPPAPEALEKPVHHPVRLWALAVLYRSGGRSTKTLAAAGGISSRSLSRHLAALEGEGLVRVVRRFEEARAIHEAYLTSAGRRALESHMHSLLELGRYARGGPR